MEVPVVSSNIESLDYNAETQDLIVKFHGGRRYKATPVPQSVYKRFLKAKSKGKFFNECVKDVYMVSKLEGE